jgi:uncharacterized lipoprotein YmbA
MRRKYRRMRFVAAALPLMVLLACQSAPTRTYTLYAIPVSSSKDYTGPALRVDSVHVPASIDRTEIMLDVAPGELKISDFDHWSAPLGEMARQTLSQDLIARLPAGKVIFPHLFKPSGALGITVDILAFRTDRGNSHLTASWAILPQAPNAAPKGGSASLSTPNANGGVLDTVQALSTLLGQLADRIVAEL